MKHLVLLACLSAAGAFAAVDGTVVNRTTGKPQAGAPVTMVELTSGMQPVGSVLTDAHGRFHFDGNPQGTVLLQVTHQGVTYSQHIQAGQGNQEISIYDSSKKPGAAKVTNHLLLLEPTGDRLNVDETFFMTNGGKTTFNDPGGGTLRFYAPKEAAGLAVSAIGPQGMPIPQQPKALKNGAYAVDFPVRPGETRFTVRYSMAFTAPGGFEGRSFYPDVPVRIATPQGVTLSGEGVRQVGEEPSMHIAVFEVQGAEYKLSVEGTGVLTGSSDGEEDSGPQVTQVLPRVYKRAGVIVGAALLALAFGFLMLYRRGAGSQA